MPPPDHYIAQNLLAEPHIAGRQLPVLTLVERVEGRGFDPRTVAARHNLDIATVYAALLYSHEYSAEFAELRREREELMAEIELDIDRPDDVNPPSR